MAVLGRWTGGTIGSLNPNATWAAPNGLFPTQARNDSSAYSFASSTSTLTLPSSGLADGYLLIARFELDTSANDRTTPQGQIIQASGTGNFVGPPAGGYMRNNANDQAFVSCWAFVDNPSASSTYQFQWKTDVETTNAVDGTTRSSFDVIPLYYSNHGIYSSTDHTLMGGTTPNVVPGWSTVNQSDTAAIERTTNLITVKGDNKTYLVISGQFYEGRGGRTQRWLGHDYDGTQDDAAKAYVYYREGNNDESGGHIFDLIQTVTANRTIEATCYRGDGIANNQGGADVDGSDPGVGDHGLVVLELNDDAEVFRSTNASASSQDIDAGTSTNVDISGVNTVTFNDSASFTKASATAVNAEQAMDALVGANIGGASRTVSSGTRYEGRASLTINGTEQTEVFHGNYMRGAQSTTDTFGWGANPVGFAALSSGDDVGFSCIQTGDAGDATVQAGWVGFWGLNLDTLEAATAITGTGSMTESVDTVSGAAGVAISGSSLSKEILTNVSFETASDWVFNTGWSHDATNEEADGSGLYNVNLSQTVSLTAGTIYRIEFEVKNYTSGVVRWRFGGVGVLLGTSRNANGTYVEYVKATGNSTQFALNGNDNFTGSIDNVSLKAVRTVESDDTLSATGTASFGAITGSANVTETDDTVAGVGNVSCLYMPVWGDAYEAVLHPWKLTNSRPFEKVHDKPNVLSAWFFRNRENNKGHDTLSFAAGTPTIQAEGIYFDGDTDKAELSSEPAAYRANTVSFVVRFRTSGGYAGGGSSTGHYAPLFSTVSDADAGQGTALYIGDNGDFAGQLLVEEKNASASAIWSQASGTANTFNDGRWHTAVVWIAPTGVNGSLAKVFVDGREVIDGELSGTISRADSGLQFGSSDHTWWYDYKGDLELFAYVDSVSEGQAQAISANPYVELFDTQDPPFQVCPGPSSQRNIHGGQHLTEEDDSVTSTGTVTGEEPAPSQANIVLHETDFNKLFDRGLAPLEKPQYPVEIDWTHPLARDLKYFIIFQNGLPVNLVTGEIHKSISGTPGFTNGAMDCGAFDSDNSYGVESNTENWSTADRTLASRHYLDTTGNNYIHIINETSSTYGSFEQVATTDYRFWWNGTNYRNVSGIINSNAWNSTIGTIKGSELNTCINGQLQTRGGYTGTPNTLGGTLTIGDRGDGGRPWGGLIDYVAMWQRGMDDEEMVAFQRNPYQILKPAGWTQRIVAAAQATGNFWIPKGSDFNKAVLEPNLLIGKQPAGPIEIDWDHPLAKGLAIAVIGNKQYEIVNRYTYGVQGSNAKWISLGNDMVMDASDDASGNAVFELEGSEGKNAPSAGSISCYWYGYHAGAYNGTILAKRDNANANFQLYTTPGTVSGHSGKLAFRNSVTPDTSEFSVSGWHGVGVSFDPDADTNDYYGDGFFDKQATNATGVNTQTTHPVSVGARWSTYPGRGYEGDQQTVIALVWYDRVLTAEEHWQIHNNPYQIFKPAGISQYLDTDAAAPSGVTGTASVTETDDTVNGVGDVAIDGSATVTEADDTVSSAATTAITADAAVTEDDDTVVGVATVAITGTSAVTEDDDTVVGVATATISGDAALTEDDDTLVATGVVPITADSSVTEEDDTATSSGTIPITGDASVTEEDDTLNGQATAGVTGDASLTEDDDTLVGTGVVPITGDSNVTEDDDTLNGVATTAITADASVTEEDDTTTSAVVIPIYGNSSVTEEDDTVNGVGSAGLTGTGSMTEDDDTVNGQAEVLIDGTSNVTEEDDNLTSAVVIPIDASASVTEEDDSLVSAAGSSVFGFGSMTEDDDTVTSAAVIPLFGDTSVTEDDDTLNGQATTPITGSGSVTEDDDTVTSAVVIPITGDCSVTEDDDTCTATGSQGVTGDCSVTEEDDTCSGSGTVTGEGISEEEAPTGGWGVPSGRVPWWEAWEPTRDYIKQQRQKLGIEKAEADQIKRVIKKVSKGQIEPEQAVTEARQYFEDQQIPFGRDYEAIIQDLVDFLRQQTAFNFVSYAQEQAQRQKEQAEYEELVALLQAQIAAEEAERQRILEQDIVFVIAMLAA